MLLCPGQGWLLRLLGRAVPGRALGPPGAGLLHGGVEDDGDRLLHQHLWGRQAQELLVVLPGRNSTAAAAVPLNPGAKWTMSNRKSNVSLCQIFIQSQECSSCIVPAVFCRSGSGDPAALTRHGTTKLFCAWKTLD